MMINDKKDFSPQNDQLEKSEQARLFGLDPDESLLSAHFAPTENHFMSEYDQEEQEK